MQSSSNPQWWVIPGVIIASITAISTLGAIFMLPGKVEQVEAGMVENRQSNAKQDLILERLTTLQETYQPVMRLPKPIKPDYREFDTKTRTYWCCFNPDYDTCWNDQLWTEKCG